MTEPSKPIRRAAIACGGTGGHLFPGLAVADELLRRGCRVTVLVSPKEVDQQAVQGATGFEVVTLPAVGLVRGRALHFWRGFCNSYRFAKSEFRQRPPQAALAMGGFTSAPPILAARCLAARTFLHESNAVPGRANRWLSWIVDAAFVGFPAAAARLHTRQVKVTGTPVRRQFGALDGVACRAALGLEPGRPVILVMGGSQGARGINELVMKTLPLVARLVPQWQWVHLAGSADCERVRQAYVGAQLKAVVQDFCNQMELALGAATAAVSRAGASALAELCAGRVPSILIPYPVATDDHQYHNARAVEATGAGVLLPQAGLTPQALIETLRRLVEDQAEREKMRLALAGWHRPQAAKDIAKEVLAAVCISQRQPTSNPFAAGAATTEPKVRREDEANSPHRLHLAHVPGAGSTS